MIPMFCEPSFLNRSPEVISQERKRVCDIQKKIHDTIESYKQQEFNQISFRIGGKEKLDVPYDNKTFVNVFLHAKIVCYNSIDNSLISLIENFSDCKFLNKYANADYDCYEVTTLLYGIDDVPGYFDEIMKLVNFLNEKVLKGEGLDSFDDGGAMDF